MDGLETSDKREKHTTENMAALSQREKAGPGTPKPRTSKQRTPEIESEDGFGEFVEINCGSVHGKLYLGKFWSERTKRGVGKCVLSGGKWYSPSEFEGFGGKTTKNWKKSILHAGRPLGEFQLERNVDLASANSETQLEAVEISTESSACSEFQQLFNEVEKSITNSVNAILKEALLSLQLALEEKIGSLKERVDVLHRKECHPVTITYY